MNSFDLLLFLGYTEKRRKVYDSLQFIRQCKCPGNCHSAKSSLLVARSKCKCVFLFLFLNEQSELCGHCGITQANVMVEYNFDEAVELLEKNQSVAQRKLVCSNTGDTGWDHSYILDVPFVPAERNKGRPGLYTW